MTNPRTQPLAQDVPALALGTSWAKAHDELVVLHPATGEYHSLNKVAARIWELTVARSSLLEIGRTLSEEFEVDEATAGADVMQLWNELTAIGLLVRD